MAYYNNEYDTGFVLDDKTGTESPMFTVTVTLAEYRDLVTKAAENAAIRFVTDNIDLRGENKKLREEIADLKRKLERADEFAVEESK